MTTGATYRLKEFLNRGSELGPVVGKTYFALRAWVAVLGFLLPVVLIVVGHLQGVGWDAMNSLSAFYWLDGVTRDVFVGILCAVGLTLIVYDGYGVAEDWLLNGAGVALIVVALKPMPRPIDPNAPFRFSVHYASAVTFFLLIAITIFACARNTLDAPPPSEDPARWAKVKKHWIRIYNGLAIGMVLVPALALALSGKKHATIGVEAAGVWVFALYWVAKTIELRRISKVETPAGQVVPLRWAGGHLLRQP